MSRSNVRSGRPTDATHRVHVNPVDDVTDDACVRHYDELAEDGQDLLADLTRYEIGSANVTEDTAGAFRDGEIIVYTGYYRLTLD